MSQLVKILTLFSVVGLGWALPAQAQTDVFWTNTGGDNDFANTANWDPAYPVAANSDVAIIQNGGYADLSTTPDAIVKLKLGADLHTTDPAGSGTLNVLSGGSLVSSTVYIGESGGQTGTLNITGGAVDSSSGSLCVGYGENSTGYFNMSSGSYTTAGHLYLGTASGSMGYMDVSGGTLSFTNASRYLRMGYADGARGVVNLSGTGTISVEGGMDSYVGYAAGSVVTFKQDGGTFNGTGDQAYFRIGSPPGTVEGSGYGFYEMKSGDLNVHGLFIGDSYDDVGAFYQSGGTITISGVGEQSSVRVSSSGDGIGTYNLTGGTLTGAIGDTEYIRCGGSSNGSQPHDHNWGHLNVSGTGQITNFDYLRITSCDENGETQGYLTLGTGGLISVGLIADTYATVEGGGEAFFTFHGGTLQARRTTTDWVKVPSETGGIFVGTEGGILDTQEFDVTITQPIQHLEGYGVDSITVTGQGTGYAGPPIVQISGGSGWGATAVAEVDTDPGSADFGKVTGITVTNPGTGYLAGDTLTVELLRGGYTTIATATVTLAENDAVDGGLTKIGSGTLTLSGTNTYTGDTIVNEGTLSITTNDTLSDTSALCLASGTVMDLNFDISLAETVAGLSLDGIAQELGTWGSSDSGASNINDTYFSGTGMLLVVSPAHIPGDTNGDRIVNDADANVVATNWGQTGLTDGASVGDFNKDGAVNGIDASIMAAHWGDHNAEAGEEMVPEPCILITIFAGLASLAFIRHRK